MVALVFGTLAFLKQHLSEVFLAGKKRAKFFEAFFKTVIILLTVIISKINSTWIKISVKNVSVFSPVLAKKAHLWPAL